MTALKQYQRLESPGVWRPDAEAQRRNVVVTFGEASLVLTDRAENPLTHWSLPALIRQNPGEEPAVYIPGPDATESLEIEDRTMIEAIETIRKAVSRSRPRPGRLRMILSASGGLAIAAIVLLVLPGVLVRHTSNVVPDLVRAEIGAQLLDRISRVSGTACETPAGQRALSRLSRRLFTGDTTDLVVLPAGVATTAHLPGDILLINRALAEDFEGPEALAGFLLAEDTRRHSKDPLKRLLQQAGTMAAFRLLTTGRLPKETLDSYAETLLTQPSEDVSDDTLLSRFETAGLSTRAYAYALDVSGETTLALIEADPVREGADDLLVSDADWVRIQSICGE